MDALNQLTDEALVQMYANGDDSAFDVLLCRYKRKVFSYINMVVKDKDVASDPFRRLLSRWSLLSAKIVTKRMASLWFG